MKKTITQFAIFYICLFAYLLICTSASAQNVNIPDANFKAKLVGKASINTNGDGEIQVSEAVAFTGTIDVNWSTISNLTGIEAFTAITGLNCSINQLTSLDVSANTALTYLNCGFNPLTGLNLSANTALTDLTCDNNQLTALNLSANTVLISLNCNYNQLTALALSANMALTFLICNNNQLTTLNLSANTALTGLYCFDNQLTDLDIKNGNNSNLTAFDAKNNTGLTCIQVDDAAFMNTNWANAKDAGASYSTNCGASLSSAKDITAFSFTTPASTGTITGTNISLTVPNGTNVTNLVSSFTNSALSTVKVGATAQVSGTTPNDFTNPVTYTVTAEDASTQNYTVTVTILTGVNEFETSNLKFEIFPNPFTHTTTIEIKSEIVNSKSEILIYDVLGQEVHRQQILNPKSEILNLNLPSGIYFYKLKNENGTSRTESREEVLANGKLIIQ